MLHAETVRRSRPSLISRVQRADKGNVAAVAALMAIADRHAQDLLPIIDDIRAGGISTLKGIAGELNARGILTARAQVV